MARIVPGLAFAVVLGSSAVAFAQTRATPSTPAPDGRRFVAIGCLSRQGAQTAPRYMLTDSRGASPQVYRLEGTASQLDTHVGHLVEVAGPLTPAAAGARGVAAAPRLTVTSLVWIATACNTVTR